MFFQFDTIPQGRHSKLLSQKVFISLIVYALYFLSMVFVELMGWQKSLNASLLFPITSMDRIQYISSSYLKKIQMGDLFCTCFTTRISKGCKTAFQVVHIIIITVTVCNTMQSGDVPYGLTNLFTCTLSLFLVCYLFCPSIVCNLCIREMHHLCLWLQPCLFSLVHSH